MRAKNNYLTEPQDNGFDPWLDVVIEAFSPQFVMINEGWYLDYPTRFVKWADNLFKKGTAPELAAAIIEKAFNIYIKPQKP